AKGKAAIDAKKYDDAAKNYAEARKLFATDVALNGQKAAEALRDRERAAAKAAQGAKADEAKKAARVKELVGQADKALAAKKYDEAIKHYREVGTIDRANAQALAGLSRAERERDADALRVKREKQSLEDYKLAMSAGQDAAKKKNHQGAVNAYNLALKYKPGDSAATAALAEAQRQLKTAQQGSKAGGGYANWTKQGA